MRNIGEYKYLKFTELFKTGFWDYYTLSNFNKVSSNYDLVNLKEVLNHRKEFINISDKIDYKRCRVQINGKGVVLRDEIYGKDIKTKKQQLCKADDFLVAEIDAKVGGYGIVPKELEGAIVSGHYFLFEINKSKLLPQFLGILVKHEQFFKQVKATGSTNYAAIRPYHVLDYVIPLPPLPEQEAIVANYYSKIREAEELERQAEDLEDEIERYLFKELDLDDIKEKIYSNKLKIINSSEITRWGVDYISGINSAQFLKSKKFKNEILKNIVQINPSTTLPKQVLPISFVPMECISDEYGEVIELREKQTNEAKGYTKFIEGDLLWARITPCMQNGKSAIVKNLKNNFGCGSTEFHVIRNTSSEIELEYIYQILRLKTVLSHARSHFTGSAGQQRVPKSFLEELMIPIPPYSIQKAISEEINKMKALKKQNRLKAALLKEEAQQEFENAIFEH